MNVIAKRVTIHISEECNPFSFVFYPIICGKKLEFYYLSIYSFNFLHRKTQAAWVQHRPSRISS